MMKPAPSPRPAHSLLVVEDEPRIAQGLAENLEAEGYRVRVAPMGETALACLQESPCDLVVLDLMLPGMSGFEVLRALRHRQDQTPVLILSAKGEQEDRLAGFALGADDYLGKPFAMPELLARIRAILRRSHPETPRPREVKSGPFRLHFLHLTAHRGRTDLGLTSREFRLLEALVSCPGRILSRRELLNMAWEQDARPSPRVVDTHIAALRRKLGESEQTSSIQTIEREGYRWIHPVHPCP